MNFLWTLPVPVQTFRLLLSNVLMTFAWYGHLKNPAGKPWLVAALVSWGIKLVVFVPFAVICMKQPLKWDYLWAGLCLVGAVYFIFRS